MASKSLIRSIVQMSQSAFIWTALNMETKSNSPCAKCPQHQRKSKCLCLCVCVSLWGVDAQGICWLGSQDSEVIVLLVFDREDFLSAGCLPAAPSTCEGRGRHLTPANDLWRGGTCTLLAPAATVITCGGWCIVSSQNWAPHRCYCNSLQAGVVFSLLCNGLNGKHVVKSTVLLEGRKINQEERLPSSLCTPPSSMRCQEKFRSVTQRRQGSSLHINTFWPPLQHPQNTHLV